MDFHAALGWGLPVGIGLAAIGSGMQAPGSNVVPDALFVMWDTQFTNDQEWETFIGSLIHVMENSANFFELGFDPFKERV